MPLSGEITVEPLGNQNKPEPFKMTLDEAWRFYEENGEAGKVVVNNLLRAMYNEILALRKQVEAAKATAASTTTASSSNNSNSTGAKDDDNKNTTAAKK